MGIAAEIKLKQIENFRGALNKGNFYFKEHNNGMHFRVVKDDVWYNVYPTTGKVRSADNLKEVSKNANNFFNLN